MNVGILTRTCLVKNCHRLLHTRMNLLTLPSASPSRHICWSQFFRELFVGKADRFLRIENRTESTWHDSKNAWKILKIRKLKSTPQVHLTVETDSEIERMNNFIITRFQDVRQLTSWETNWVNIDENCCRLKIIITMKRSTFVCFGRQIKTESEQSRKLKTLLKLFRSSSFSILYCSKNW